MMKSILISVILILTMNLDVPNCQSSHIQKLLFTTIDGKTADSTTSAIICHDAQNLIVNWTSIDTEIISTYTRCNDPLYKEDVVEIFISTLDSYPKNYFQIQVSPKGVLFFADITNPNGNCTNLGTQYYDCNSVKYTATRTERGWNAHLQIKLSIIGRGRIQNKFMVNVFRIDYSTKIPARYLTWQPTFTNPACFHRPTYFQQIDLI